MSNVEVLASDMDGTFIPLEGNSQNRRDLETLRDELEAHQISLMYVTGRHLELVEEAIEQQALPRPEWISCDVGTSIYRKQESGYQRMDAYADHLRAKAGELPESFVQSIATIESVRLQEAEKQGEFKRSFYCDAKRTDQIAEQVEERLRQEQNRYHVVASRDPFTGDGLIDLLPRGVSKAYALKWWGDQTERDEDAIIFAGDTGNDLAALTAGFRAIVVGNAEEGLISRVQQALRDRDQEQLLYVATEHATSGVLEGLQFFLGEGSGAGTFHRD